MDSKPGKKPRGKENGSNPKPGKRPREKGSDSKPGKKPRGNSNKKVKGKWPCRYSVHVSCWLSGLFGCQATFQAAGVSYQNC